MKNFKLIKLLALFVVLITSINTTWAYTIWHANIYYDDLASGWNSDVCIALEKGSNQPGSGNGGATLSMTHIDNTKLWYWYGENWGDGAVHYFRFAKITGTKYNWYSWWKNSSTDRVEDTWTWYQTDSWAGVSGGYGESVNNETKLYVSSGTNAGDGITSNSLTSYTAMNYTQTLQQHLSTNGGAYSASTDAIATVKVSSYYLTGASTSAATGDQTIAAGYSSTSCTAARTAVVTYTVSNVKPGYKFVGWYDGNTEKSTSTTYSYNASSDKTITARFQKLYAYVEGRFRVYNSARDSRASVGGQGSWVKNSTAIPMEYDAANSRFVLHTYSTPAELKTAFTGGTGDADPYFFIKTSTSSSSISSGDSDGPTEYWATSTSSSQDKLLSAGTKRAVSKTSSALSFVGNTSSANEYVVLYCDGSDVWYSVEYQLTYDGNGKTAGSLPTYAYAASGGSITAAAKPNDLAKNGYTFSGWNAANDASGTNYTAGSSSITMGAANKTVYAKWTQNITLNQNGATTEGSTSLAAMYNAVLSATGITNPEKTNYTFAGWTNGTGGLGDVVINASKVVQTVDSWTDGSKKWIHAGASTLYASWTEDKHDVDVGAGDHGNVSTAKVTNIGVETASGDITATADEGYHFVSWTLPDGVTAADGYDEEDNPIQINATDDDLTITANFEANEYTITLDDRSATTAVSPSSVKATYDANTLSSSITNPIKTNYTFAGWYLDYETGSGIGTSQLINTSGSLNASVSPYTDASRNWVNDGGVTVYARWKANANVDKFNFQYGSGTYYGSGWTVANFGDATNNKRTVDFTMPDPSSKKCYVGWGGDFIASGLGSGSGWSSEINLTDVRLAPCTSATVGTATGATGKLVIWDNSSSANLYIGFEPSGYAVGTADRNIALTAGADNFYYTDVVTISSTEAAGNFQVKLATSSSYTTCGHGTAENASTVSGRKITGDADIANGSKGVFQMWNNSNTNNFGLRFVTVYDVEFNLQGHGDAIDDYTDVRYNDKISAPTDPTADGYVFHGWFKEAGCVNEWDFASDVVTTETILYAKWTSNIGTINAVSGTNGVYRATYGEKTISITTEPTRTGYEVEAYYLNYNAGYQNPYSNPIATSGGTLATNTAYTDEYGNWDYEGNAPTIYANWQNKTYTITLNENIPDGTEGSAGDASFTAQYNTNTFSTISNYPTAVGYTFAGYYDDPDDGEGVLVIKDATQSYGKNSGTIYINSDGNWISSSEELTLYAHWTANEYTITLNDRNATSAVSPGSVTATFASNTLESITAPDKWGSTFGGWETSGGTLVIDAAGAFVETETDYTDGSGNWKYDRKVTLYAVWTPKEHLYWIPGDNSSDKDGKATGAIEFTSVGDGKYYVTIDTDEDDVFHLGDGENAGGPSSDKEFILTTSSCGLNSNANTFTYKGDTKQTVVYVLDLNAVTLDFEHLVIYKPGEDEYDLHTAIGAEDGYSGTIYGQFEYRQRVDGTNKWSTLYLPYKPTLVQAWGGTSYHNLYPCHRPVADGPLYEGYYVIRTPGQTTNLPIKDFKQWNDPTSYSSWTPEANTPYIIMWQLDWFRGKYISFWGNGGDTGVTFGSSFVAGDAPTADGVVNVLGNGTMVTGYVAGAYVLAEEYGDGAWLRGDKPTDLSTVGPFECYIRANAETTGKTHVIKRRTGEETPTGWEDVLNSERKAQVVVYTITGLRVTEYNDCSFDEAGRRLSETYNEGIFIMRAGDESVKLMLR